MNFTDQTNHETSIFPRDTNPVYLGIWAGIMFLIMSLCPAVVSAESTVQADRKVILRVNGYPVFSDELDAAVDRLLPAAVFHGGVSPEQRERYREEGMELLINRELLYQAAVREDLDVKALVDSEMKRIETSYGSQDAFRKDLDRMHLDLREFRTRVSKDILAEVYAEREIRGKVHYSEKDLKAYYEDNKEMFRRPPAINLWHIILKVEPNASLQERQEKQQEAGVVAELAREGVDFEMLARKYSEDDYRVLGGKRGLVHEGMLAPKLESAAFGLSEGEIAGPIETIYGYHILKAGKREEGQLLPFEQVREKIRETLEARKMEELKAQVLSRLKTDARIEVP